MADEMQKGQWSNPKDLGVVATHSILLHTGKVLMFSFDEKNETQPRKVNAKVFDPMTEEVIPVDRPPKFPKPRNLFCGGHCMLPDGRLLVVGGNDWYWGPHYDVHTFHPETLSWTEHKSMRKGRYYPTCTTLPDGTAFISSGAKFRFLFGIVFINKSYEIFDSQKNSLTHKGRFASGRFLSMYPFVHVLPSGDLFVHSKNETRLFDPRTFIMAFWQLPDAISKHAYLPRSRHLCAATPRSRQTKPSSIACRRWCGRNKDRFRRAYPRDGYG